MGINNLQTFVKMTEYSSFSLAAESLRLTQPAVSKKRIATLESELDRRLFVRIGHRVTLTEGGKMKSLTNVGEL